MAQALKGHDIQVRRGCFAERGLSLLGRIPQHTVNGVVPSVLIVEDEPAVGKLLAFIFANAGYDVHIAYDAVEAMAVCASQDIDVVVSDVVMAPMDGHQLVRWVRAVHPDTRMVLMSGSDIRCDGCVTEGRCKLIMKPFAPDEIVALVEEVLHPACQ